MKIYEIVAEYGPVAADSIKFLVIARDSGHAKSEGIKVLKREYDVQWPRIGDSNVYVREHVS